MLLAWMLTGSVGTFIASFYKPDWPSKTLSGQKVWFQVSKSMDSSGQSPEPAPVGPVQLRVLVSGHGGRPETFQSCGLKS